MKASSWNIMRPMSAIAQMTEIAPKHSFEGVCWELTSSWDSCACYPGSDLRPPFRIRGIAGIAGIARWVPTSQELSSEFAKFDAKNDTLGPPVISVIVFWHLSAKPGAENWRLRRKNEDCAHKGTKCDDFEEKTPKVRPGVCTVYTVQYILYSIYCTVYTAQYKLYSI